MEHKQKMLKIGAGLTHRNVIEIKYIFGDKIGDGVLERINDGLEMIRVLERIGTIDKDNYKELIDLLEGLGRKDLISIIDPQSQQSNWSNMNNKLNSITNPTSTDATYNDVLTPNIIDKVAIQLGTEWLRFGHHLNLKDADLDHIDVDYKKAYDKAFQLLKLWKQKSKEGCITWSKLKYELQQFNRNDIIRELETEFKHLKDNEYPLSKDNGKESLTPSVIRENENPPSLDIKDKLSIQESIVHDDVRDMDELNIESIISKLKKVTVLGSCAYGKVHLCIDENTGKKLAMKCIETQNIDNNVKAKDEVAKFQHEISLFQSLNHERIVKYYGSAYTNTTISILMEFMEGGSLYDEISNKGVFDEKTASEKSFQILVGLEYLHNKNIVHRDIKSANILLDLYGNCKLADFGISKQIQTISSCAGCKTDVGTPYWMSPEVINATVHDIEYGKKADIWSFGCTVLEMLTTKPPWSHLDPRAAIFHIGTKPTIPHLPDNSSNSCKTFVNNCFERDPKLRPNTSQLLTYNWVKRSA